MPMISALYLFLILSLLRAFLNCLIFCETCSGLRVNFSKTEAIWIGSCRQNTETPLGLKWCNSVKALGIVFTYNEVDLMSKNFYDKLKDIRLQTSLWSCRGVSLYGN